MGLMPPGHGAGPPSFWMWGGRRRRSPDTGTANSGLTGDSTFEGPVDEGPKDLRGRLNSLKQSIQGTSAALRRVMRLVWEARRRLTAGLFIVTVIAALSPAACARTPQPRSNAAAS